MQKTKSIILFGTYAEQNLGDDLMLISQILKLREYWKNINIFIFTGDCAITEKLLKSENISLQNLKLIYTGRKGLREPGKPLLKSFAWFFTNIKTIFSTNLLLIGPGNQIQDVTRKFRLLFFLSRGWLAWFFRTPFAFFGIGYYQIKSNLVKKVFKITGNTSSFISTRDFGGTEKFIEVGIKKEKVFPLADVSFTYPWKAPKNEHKEKNIIGFTSRIFLKEVFTNKISTNFEKCYGNFLREVSEKHNATLIFFPFYKTKPWQDTVSLKRLIKYSGNENLPIKIANFNNLNELSTEISNVDAFIGVRYHSVLIAVQHKIPVMGISYAHKTKRFMAENNLSDYVINLEDVNKEKLTTTFTKLWNNKNSLKKTYKITIEKEAKLAQENFELIKKTITLGN